jgi:predicted lipoprotein with Yx(FWY)xxD motif
MRISASLALLAVSALLVACGSDSSNGAESAVVARAEKAKVGNVLVDAEGRTLYRFTAEAQGLPVCTGACVGTWTPALAGSASGLPKHVATVKRPDGGKLQLTYDGHPCTATPATGRRPTPTARASAASGMSSRPQHDVYGI